MESIRFVQKQGMDEAAKLADLTFRKEGHQPMADAFPLIFSGAYASSVGMYVDDKLVSFMGLVPSQMKIGAAAIPCFSLGSVCTDIHFRGKGYAGLLLDRVFEHIEASQGSLLLVSGDRSLYTRRGCVYFGSVYRYKLTREQAYRLPSLVEAGATIREAEERDRLVRQQLADSSQVRFERGLLERAVLEQARAQASLAKLEQRIFVVEREGVVEAFITLGIRGPLHTDASPMVIDWGGKEDVVAAALGTLITDLSLPELRLAVLWQETGLLAQLKSFPFVKGMNQGTVKLVNPVRFWNQLLPYLETRDEDALAHIDVNEVRGEDKVELTVAGVRYVIPTTAFASLLFNPDPDVAPELGSSPWLNKLLPIPLPYTAGLNFI
ncbi:MAG: GNAT family N-acetyltransferase [Paenibacillus sp.]|nr:GNAT family N-acetyltransferase [Paenibacillus sp.]